MSNQVSTQLQPSSALIDAETMKQARSLADILGKTNMVPKQYIGKPDDIFIAILMGAQLGLNPFTALQGIATINGTPSVWGDVQLAICRSNPNWDYMEETVEKDPQEGFVATCKVYRKGEKTPYTGRFSIADATTAKLMSKDTYINYPKKMISNRARSWALRAAFADALKGIASADEMQDVVDVTATAEVKSTEVPEVKQAKKRQVKEADPVDAPATSPVTPESSIIPETKPPADLPPRRIFSADALKAEAINTVDTLGKEQGTVELKKLCAKYAITKVSECPEAKWDDFAMDLDALRGLQT